MILYVAEKPSLAEAIAHALGKINKVKPKKANNYWEVGDDRVGYLAGHVYGLALPGEQDERYQDFFFVPVIPRQWKLKPDPQKIGLIKTINDLLKKADIIVNAGDAGREGQLLVDQVLVEAGVNPFAQNVKRLWVSSIAEKDLIRGIENLLDNADKETLYKAAVARQRGDYMHGMTFSREYTRRAKEQGVDITISVGRVQTPTLYIAYHRHMEIKNFKPIDYYLPVAEFQHANGKFKGDLILRGIELDENGRLTNKEVADTIAEACRGQTGIITEYNSEKHSEAAPLPYDLSTLTKECSSKFAFSAKKTLEIAQELYDMKVTTYPRTESRHLNTALREEAPLVFKSLQGSMYEPLVRKADLGYVSPAWNDSKVSDHHGIIPTNECTLDKLGRLSNDCRKVFDLIVRNYLAQFFTPFKYNALSAVIKVDKYNFKATGRQILENGWQVAFTKIKNEGDEEEEVIEEGTLPGMAQGDEAKVLNVMNPKKVTKPPSKLTDGTLVEEMKAAHKYVTDENIKKRLRETSGLGTQATRANTIEELLARGFLKRVGKNQLDITELGISVIDNVLPDLRDIGMTALWEDALSSIIDGKLPFEKYMEKIESKVLENLNKIASTNVVIKGARIQKADGHGETCPKCNKGTMLTGKSKKTGGLFLYCNNRTECDHIAFPKEEIEPLPDHGKTCPKCNTSKLMTRKVFKGEHKGKRFLMCEDENCKHFEFEKTKIDPLPDHGKTCTKCNHGKMITRMVFKGEHKGKRFLMCDNQAGECKNFEFPSTVKPIDGHGKECPKCKTSIMVTREVFKGDHKGKKYLMCQNKECKHFEFPSTVKPLPGHGNPCPKCEKGKLITREAKKGPNAGKTFLACSERECGHIVNDGKKNNGGGGNKGDGGSGRIKAKAFTK